jgi:bacteriocin biosynthesis cyclodehydratase domain-containing protein
MDQTQSVEQSQRTVDLPRRPRVLPGLAVLRRNETEVQIGIDPRHGVMLDGMSEALIDMLPAMNGEATVRELLDRLPDEHSRQAALVLLASLTDAGLLEDAAPPEGAPGPQTPARLSADATAWALRTGNPRSRLAVNRQQAAVAVRGEGRLGIAIACLLAAAGVGWVDFAAVGNVRAEDTGTGYLDTDVDTPRQQAGLTAIHRSVCTARTGTLPPSRKPDLAILTDLVVPSPSMIAPLHAEGVPYMLVRMRDGTGVVGPLIVPGRTSCPNCMDLLRTDLDPTWPMLALQLAGRLQPGELAATQAAAGFAAAQALVTFDWWLTGVGTPALCNASLEIDTVSGTVTPRPWEPHPDCRCGAAGVGEASV